MRVEGRHDLGTVTCRRTEWPLLRGPMSRKASVLSDSKIFRDGISPIARQWLLRARSDWPKCTLDDFAEYAGGHCGAHDGAHCGVIGVT